MKKILIATCLLVNLVNVVTARAVAGGKIHGKINKLVRVETSMGEHASQLVFEFMHPLYYEREVSPPSKEKSAGERVTLYFPGISLTDFKELQVMGRIKSLAVVKNVSVKFERVPVERVAVTIDFIKNSVLLRLTKMEEPNLLVIDIFDKAVLESIRKKVTTTLYACNTQTLPNLRASKKKRFISPRKAHIVIDAGHGGVDSGACSFGLKEKKFTLDIARRACAALRREGYRVSLTRDADEYLSVLDRVHLARQLKADLFVSVHVNAVAGLNHVSGVETYFFDGSPYFNKKHKKKVFLFVRDAYDRALARTADKVLYKKISDSRKLSNFIHQGVLNCLKTKKIDVENRGVKKACFGVLMRNEAPASLVEVGFLTNKKEARRLTQPLYRNWLSQGICNGIKRFLLTHKKI